MIKTRLTTSILVALSGCTLSAQDSSFPHHNFTFNAGGVNPGGQLKSFMGAAPAVGFSYGYRFSRYLQADAGLDVSFGAANVSQFVNTDLGVTRIRDREYMLPFGGRAIAPLLKGRLLLAGGGGAAYLRYSESIQQVNYYYQVSCPTCTSRSGWGPYGLASGSYFLDSGRHFRVGVTSMFIRAHTNGDTVGNVPGVRTSDHWANVYGELGFSF